VEGDEREGEEEEETASYSLNTPQMHANLHSEFIHSVIYTSLLTLLLYVDDSSGAMRPLPVTPLAFASEYIFC
jgi:hypothetical protein